MPEQNDHELLAEFARSGSETAFATLATRHVGLVFSTAFRVTGNSHQAEEITQAVFIILARKAGQLSPLVVLSGWLYQTARLTAANFMKAEIRRRRREQEVYMQSTLDADDSSTWEKIAPLLDEAMGALGETDRNAVVLRYFENKNAAEIGSALRMNEDTARRRVNRALEKLRIFFRKRGVTLSADVIAVAVSSNFMQSTPAGLMKTITAVVMAKGTTAGSSTLALVKGVLKLMAWTNTKTAIVVSIGLLFAAGTTTVLVEKQIQAKQYTVAQEPWSDAGASTPKAALQSLASALTRGNFDRAETLMQWDEKGAPNLTTPAFERRLALESALAPALKNIKSFRILSIEQTGTPNELKVTFKETFKNSIAPYAVAAILRRVDGQWRVVGNIGYFPNGGIDMKLPFTGLF